jgi:1-acyl-sn-glycerol-3-phosphate acyltransferase
MALVRSLLFMVVFYLGSILFVTGAFIGAFSHQPILYYFVRRWSLFHRWSARHILGIETRIEGTFTGKPVLYAIKHESMFETIEVPGIFDRPAVVAKQELFRIPLWGRAAKAYGMSFVDRAAGAGALRKMIGWGKDMRAAGRPIVIFPEGTRVLPGEKPPLQSGFAGLYKILGLPVIPVAVNSGRLCQHGKITRRSGTITYRFGDEIPSGLSRPEIEARVHSAINALNIGGQDPSVSP